MMEPWVHLLFGLILVVGGLAEILKRYKQRNSLGPISENHKDLKNG